MLLLTELKIFHIILSNLKGNSEEGDGKIVFDTTRQNTTGQNDGKERGALPLLLLGDLCGNEIRYDLRALIPFKAHV